MCVAGENRLEASPMRQSRVWRAQSGEWWHLLQPAPAHLSVPALGEIKQVYWTRGTIYRGITPDTKQWTFSQHITYEHIPTWPVYVTFMWGTSPFNVLDRFGRVLCSIEATVCQTKHNSTVNHCMYDYAIIQFCNIILKESCISLFVFI